MTLATLLPVGLHSPSSGDPVVSAMHTIEHMLEENWYTSYTSYIESDS